MEKNFSPEFFSEPKDVSKETKPMTEAERQKLLQELEGLIPKIKSFVSGRLAENYPTAVEDVVGDIVLRATKSIAGFRNDSSLYTWVHRIAINQVYDFLKMANNDLVFKAMRRKRVVDARRLGRVPNYERTIDTTGALELGMLRDQILKGLPKEYRDVLSLAIKDVRPTDMAGILGINEGTVKSRLSRARQLFKSRMEARQETSTEEPKRHKKADRT